MRVLTASQMMAVDRRAIDELGIPSLVLMENAAIGVADALGRHFPKADTIAILCGPGNNGGDGLALARHLEARGYRYSTFLVLGSKSLGGDAAVQREILERAEIEVTSVGPDTDLELVFRFCRQADVVIDALFGTGLSRSLDGHFLKLAHGLKELPIPLLAVDIPSGIDGSKAQPPGEYLSADLTVTFAAPKIAHVLSPAADAIGDLVICDLGIPSWLVEEAPGSLFLLTEAELAAALQPRPSDSHKGTFGHVLVVAGRTGASGAAILATKAAVRGGAGLVTAAVPEPLVNLVDGASVESMTIPIASGIGGMMVSEATDQILAAAEAKQAVALGPGLGNSAATAEAIRTTALTLELPLVLDADGLNAFSGHLGDLQQRSAATVLTPHPGEMARLVGRSNKDIQDDRIGVALEASQMSGAIVVLKGHRTVIAEPDGTCAINPTGNSGMATGGSGDVLAGLIASLLAQGYEPATATRLGVFVHGLAGDLASEELGQDGLIANDLVAALPRALRRLRGH